MVLNVCATTASESKETNVSAPDKIIIVLITLSSMVSAVPAKMDSSLLITNVNVALLELTGLVLNAQLHRHASPASPGTPPCNVAFTQDSNAPQASSGTEWDASADKDTSTSTTNASNVPQELSSMANSAHRVWLPITAMGLISISMDMSVYVCLGTGNLAMGVSLVPMGISGMASAARPSLGLPGLLLPVRMWALFLLLSDDFAIFISLYLYSINNKNINKYQ